VPSSLASDDTLSYSPFHRVAISSDSGALPAMTESPAARVASAARDTLFEYSNAASRNV
jgi:hypothetical protein